MKVICIDATQCNNLLTEGKVYTVIGEDDVSFTLKAYFLEEFGDKCPWDKKRFIPTSDIDETELVNEKELVL